MKKKLHIRTNYLFKRTLLIFYSVAYLSTLPSQITIGASNLYCNNTSGNFFTAQNIDNRGTSPQTIALSSLAEENVSASLENWEEAEYSSNANNYFSVTSLPTINDASFSYSASSFCANGSDPSPTITGSAGGTFTSNLTGLSINASTGAIDVSMSLPGTYTVTYTTAGASSDSATQNVTILARDNASFRSSVTSMCTDGPGHIATITGLQGGTFSSSPAGLSLDASTGTIDVSTSITGFYTLTYTTAGPCPNSSSRNVALFAPNSANFNYSAMSFCLNGTDDTDTPRIIVGGGVFSSNSAGLSLNTSTGTIDISASMPGSYVVTYTASGRCPNSATQDVEILAADNANFNYLATSLCTNGADPTPTITGLTGGTFTSSPAGLSLDASTGTIDVSASTAGSYVVTYTTAGPCTNSATQNVMVSTADNAAFSYATTSLCINETDATPTITGLTGGTFTSSPAGLSLDASTGTIDVSASTAGSYVVTYTTAGPCTNSTATTIAIMNCVVELEISDPCSCTNPANIQAPDGRTILFQDVLKAETMTGLTVVLESNDGNLLDNTGTPIPTGTPFVESSPGVYTLNFYTRESRPATVTVSSGLMAMTFVTDSCMCDETEVLIPTMSQWGLVIYGLVLLNLGLVFIRRKEFLVA